MSELIPVLSALMSMDNKVRNDAERYFNCQLQDNFVTCLQALIQIFCCQENELVIRSFAGVLLRRAIEKFSDSMALNLVEQFRAQLMSMWSCETNSLLLQRLSHVMAQSAWKTPWTDLIPQIIIFANSKEGSNVISILGLIEILADYCPDDIANYLNQLGQFLGQFFSASDPAIQIACARLQGLALCL